MAWRLAESLVQLRSEVDALAPNRSKRSDGTIGDAAHKGRGSDHNPNMSNVVCALDLTHDSANGADMHELSDQITTVPCHPALKYVIFNRRIWSVARANEGWRYYSGSNPHKTHMHISVGRGPDGRSIGPYDDTSRWLEPEEDDMARIDDDQAEAIAKRAGEWAAHTLLTYPLESPENGKPYAVWQYLLSTYERVGWPNLRLGIERIVQREVLRKSYKTFTDRTDATVSAILYRTHAMVEKLATRGTVTQDEVDEIEAASHAEAEDQG